MRHAKSVIRALLAMLMLVSVSACASYSVTQSTPQESTTRESAEQKSARQAQEAAIRQASIEAGDPYEKMNRSIYKFNDSLDRHILKPVAKTYLQFVPKVVRNGFGRIFTNLWEPNTALNALLQGKGLDAAHASGRFLLNSTIGILGIFDVATPFGLPHKTEDFGQTLAVWGVGNGPYLMLPFFGPSNARDLGGRIVQAVSTDLVPVMLDGSDQWAAVALRAVDTRISLLGADDILALQVDPYLFLRESYRQSRLLDINDGILPESEEDLFEESLFE